MPTVVFTRNLQQHVDADTCQVTGTTVRQTLDSVFTVHPQLKTYVLDDQGAVRKHMVVFVNGQPVSDRSRLSDPVSDDAEIYVMQALSGG